MRALSKRLVPWQHIESSMLPITYRQSLAQSLVISDYDKINMLTQR
jgi:hypothetical protein